MNEKEAYAKKQQAQLDRWAAEIKRLKAKADQADAEARIKIEEDLMKAEALRIGIKDELAQLKSSADDAWKDIRTGLDAAADNLSASLRSATSRFA